MIALERLPRETAYPWRWLRQVRCQLGMTQAAAASGIVSQSMLAHMERGRLLPSNRVLAQLAQRYGLNPAGATATFEPWRLRRQTTKRLWQAASDRHAQRIADLLVSQAPILLPFERGVYTAMFHCLDASLPQAEEAIVTAWLQGPVPIRGNYQYARASGRRSFDEGPWTRAEQLYVWIHDASVWLELSQGLGRHTAARYWADVLQMRMRCLQRGRIDP